MMVVSQYQITEDWLFADIHFRAILNGDAADSMAPVSLIARDAKHHTRLLIKKYHKAVMEYLQQHRVAERAQAAAADPNPDARILEGIDEDIFRAMMKAEKKYGISFLLPLWSPDLSEAKKRKKFWAMWRTDFRTRRNLSHPLSKISKIVPDLKEYLERPRFTLDCGKSLRKQSKETTTYIHPVGR
jgi:hypothetical protein